jgi:hypothetical protein
MINTKMGAFLLVGFIAGAFIASPELRAYAANTVFSTDIKDGEVKTPDLANNAVTSAKIKDGEVKAQDIATDAVGPAEIAKDAVGADEIAKDAVGASEIAGVDKLIFADCSVPAKPERIQSPGVSTSYQCAVAGIDPEDDVIATKDNLDCFVIQSADIRNIGLVSLMFTNVCSSSASLEAGHVSIIVYDELPDKVLP